MFRHIFVPDKKNFIPGYSKDTDIRVYSYPGIYEMNSVSTRIMSQRLQIPKDFHHMASQCTECCDHQIRSSKGRSETQLEGSIGPLLTDSSSFFSSFLQPFSTLSFHYVLPLSLLMRLVEEHFSDTHDMIILTLGYLSAASQSPSTFTLTLLKFHLYKSGRR